MIEEKRNYIMEETRARSLAVNREGEGYVKEWNIEGEAVKITVRKA